MCSAMCTSTSLNSFALAEGRKGGEFYTPRSVVRMLVENVGALSAGASYDPCCGSAGMFVQSAEFIHEKHATRNGNGGRAKGNISIYGQESKLHHMAYGQDEFRHPGHRGTDRTRRQLPQRSASRPTRRLHTRQSAFQRLRLGRGPPARRQALGAREYRLRGNANFRMGAAFSFTTSHHEAPLASSCPTAPCHRSQSGEGDIRKNLIEAGLVDCIVALAGPVIPVNPDTSLPMVSLSRGRSNGGQRSRQRRDSLHRCPQSGPHG